MRPENIIQAAIVEYIERVALEVIVFAIPNAARRTAGGRATNAVPGLRPGVFDLGLLLEDGRTAYIECKTEEGRLSTPQREFRNSLIRRGVPYAVCRSIDDARVALAQWGCVTREAA